MTAESLPDTILAVHRALADADMAHAFGGALALAWCTQRARGTIDIDVNVFVPSEVGGEVLAALPDGVSHDDQHTEQLLIDGQTRVWWGNTPIDLFLDTTPFHREVGERVRWEPFGGVDVPSWPVAIWPCSRPSSTGQGTGPISRRCVSLAASNRIRVSISSRRCCRRSGLSRPRPRSRSSGQGSSTLRRPSS